MPTTNTSEAPELRDQFFALKNPEDIAALLQVRYSDLIYWLYRIPVANRYVAFEIKKKSGSPRHIDAPSLNIKLLQQKLNQALKTVYSPKKCVHGFVNDRSVKTNAIQHKNKKYLLNIDLHDFFPSINFGRVRGMFMGKPYKLDQKVATVLAQLCCFNRRLPQGAPTSPIISNMICAQMDSQLQRLARLNRCTYTRYADDMTFSTSRRNFPIAMAIVNDLGQILLGKEICDIIRNNGFAINPEKVWLRGQDRRQKVTGVIVNKFPNLPRKYTNQIRAMLHAWMKFGLDAAQSHFEDKYDRKQRPPWIDSPQYKYVLKGKIEYLGMIKGKESSTYLRFLDRLGRLDPNLTGGRGTPRELLLRRYNALTESTDPHGRGFLLQDLLCDTFRHFGIPMEKSFTRNKGAEQIDGAFSLNGWHYIVECRWREEVADGRQVDGLMGQVLRSGAQTMGIFFSINGWSKHVPELLKQNPHKNVILMNGRDFLSVLEGSITMETLFQEKIKILNLKGEPFVSVIDILK